MAGSDGNPARRVRLARWDRELSQAELAELVGVSRDTINRVETGKIPPRGRWGYKLEETLGFDKGEIVVEPTTDEDRLDAIDERLSVLEETLLAELRVLRDAISRLEPRAAEPRRRPASAKARAQPSP